VKRLQHAILQGDVFFFLKTIKDETIDCIMTSPPYYNQRDYNIQGQIGLEKSLQEYVAKMSLFFKECFRVLKRTGTFFFNIGEKYDNGRALLIPERLLFEAERQGFKTANKNNLV